MFKRYFGNKIPFEIEKNLNRLISDTSENISKIIEQNKMAVRQYIYGELKTIEDILTNFKNESVVYAQAIDKIKSVIN